MKGSTGRCKVRAHANIALSKYWGKSDLALNLPAVPSISMTLSGLVTETEVRFDPSLRADSVFLDGRPASAGETRRVVAMLDQVRAAAKHEQRAEVRSVNRFPTAAGLASSASGFAALAAAATRAAGLEWDDRRVSALARQASASAARSIFGASPSCPPASPVRPSWPRVSCTARITGTCASWWPRPPRAPRRWAPPRAWSARA
ncbi:MAG: hypothetical protein IPH72_11485 [Sandaracinaceae bacterium]|nr:hypothetical protein [Sandaracinaceae bacterium]